MADGRPQIEFLMVQKGALRKAYARVTTYFFYKHVPGSPARRGTPRGGSTKGTALGERDRIKALGPVFKTKIETYV